MTMQSSRDEARLSVASLPPTPGQRRVVLAFTAGLVGVALVIGFIGLVPLQRSDGFIPAVQSIIAAADLITAVLLFVQYATERSRGLLLLAAGYLFTALIVAAQTLTFPGAFAPDGLLGAGAQTAAWLYVVWHLTLPAAACLYVLEKARPGAHDADPAAAIRVTVALVVTAAVVVSWLAVVAGDRLPVLLVSATTFASTASLVSAVPLAVSTLAFVMLWRRRTSVLDEWLLVALLASVAEMAIIVFIGASRYTSAFYVSRLLAVVTACAVLVALLTEMAGLYVRLAMAVRALERERANKLMNLDVVVSSIAHEIKQPLMVITTCNTIIASLLRKPKLDVADVQINLDDVTAASVRIGETIDSLRSLFKDPQAAHQHVDLNDVVRESLETLRADLTVQNITVILELTPRLPAVIGHRGQLREVLVNIVQNAIDALAGLTDRPRELRISTRATPDRVIVTIEDSGEGISADRLPNLFTAFITTKTRGMGLGLSLCQMIIGRHNGELAVSSEVGKGTRFEVSLPAEPTGTGERHGRETAISGAAGSRRPLSAGPHTTPARTPQ